MFKNVIFGVLFTFLIIGSGLSYIKTNLVMEQEEVSNQGFEKVVSDKKEEGSDLKESVTKNSNLLTDLSKVNILSISDKKKPLPEIISVPPLINLSQDKEVNFSDIGPQKDSLIALTNLKRNESGAQSLVENSSLNQVAEFKVNDLISKNYFEHISPSGESIADVASLSGYKYLIIGENLAYGNFANSSELIEAWFDSPGHRQNMLNPSYRHIGLAVRRANFQGQDTFVAVSVFATPEELCSLPDNRLKIEIDNKIKEAEELKDLILSNPVSLSDQQAISEYNKQVNYYNNLVHIVKALTAEYNLQVGRYNSCVNYF